MKLSKAVIIFVVLFLLLLFSSITQIRIKKIHCRNQYGVCSSQLSGFVKGLESRKLVEVQRSLRASLRADFQIDDYLIQYKFPNEIEIDLIEKKAVYALHFLGQENFSFVDDFGVILSFQKETSLPIVTSSSSPKNIGETISDEELFALRLMRDIFLLYQIRQGEIEDGAFYIKLADEKSVVFPLQGDREVLISSINLILSRWRDLGPDFDPSGVSEIDLRFRNPVIR